VSLVSFRGKKVLCVVSRDITPRKLAERQLIYTATHDPLTGLVNRLLLYDRLAQELARARRYNKMIGLVYIDLDRFKEINDSLGHSVGDQLLKAVGTRLKSLLRESDTLARMGGDEYMFVLGDIVNPDDVERIVKSVLASIRKPFDLEGIKHHITASVGISLYPVDGSDSEILIKAADLAMYFAKSEGRDSFKRYSSDMKVRDLKV
jgi:diguanylate cyclase (GGDEF)-like protein